MNRKPYQGVLNIIRFNPFFFITAFAMSIVAGTALYFTEGWLSVIIAIGLIFAVTSLTISILVSHWIYDRSDLYNLPWLNSDAVKTGEQWININAGFDETSHTIQHNHPNITLRILDFYNPEKHTEPSIARARKIYPPHSDTEIINTDLIPAETDSIHKILATFSLHEIRDHQERVVFFNELARVLTTSGKIYLTEHLRDTANFSVYSFGAFHFHTRKEWLNTIHESGLRILDEQKTTPFVTTFILSQA